MPDLQIHPIVAAAQDHAREIVTPSIARWEREGKFPRDAFLDAGTRGLCGIYVPTERGGQGLSFTEVPPVFEELGRVDALYGLAISVHNFVALAVSTADPDSSAGRWSQQMCRGESVGAFLLTEKGGGSDAVGSMETRATEDGDGYRLNGVKTWATFAGVADVYAVACRSGDAQTGTGDIMMVLVQADDPGVSVRRIYDKSTGSFLPIGEVEFKDVRLDAGRVLAPAGEGLKFALSTIDIARVHIAASSVGLAAAALDIALDATSKRSLFGSSVLSLQANQFALADVETSIHAGRLMYQRAAELIHQPGGTVAAAHAKRFCPDAAVDAVITCTRVMGADGSLAIHALPRLLAGAQFLTMADGATAIQRIVIGRDLVKRTRERNTTAAQGKQGAA